MTPIKLRINFREIIILAVGAIIGVGACNWRYFEIERQVSLTDLFIAAIGTYVVYIGSKLSSKATSDRVEKDLIISEITAIKRHNDNLGIFLDGREMLLTEATKLIQTISKGLLRTKEMSNLCWKNKEIGNMLDQSLGSVRILNGYLTGNEANIENNAIIFGDSHLKTKKQHEKIERELILLIININRIEGTE